MNMNIRDQSTQSTY